MDFTPNLQGISEDSGCLTGTTLEPSSTTYGETSSTGYYIETPTTTTNVSRKRKLSHNCDIRFSYKNSSQLSHEISYESPATFEKNFVPSTNFLSSTLNESLSKSLEKCNLGTYTPNFYLERSPSDFDSEQSLKRYKADDSPKYQPKTRSAPSTPTKHLEVDELYTKDKAQSEHLNGFQLTPSKSRSYHKSKLGSPERLELLYPNLKPTVSPLKLKTPEKLREFLQKINSPAKKRLFENSQVEEKIFKKVDHDPVSVFLIKNDFRHIVSQIFEYLPDRDLCTVSKVSKSWKKALTSDYKAFPRYYTYSQEFHSNKENIQKDVSLHDKSCSPPASPVRDNFHRCTKIASKLDPSQSLQKCIRCMEPAVIQRSISQCQNPNCEYIYCMNCLSFSTLGPEHFIDKCNSSELITDNKQKSWNRFSLYDISNGGNDPPSFLVNESLDTPQSKYDSSGYLSDSDMSPIIKRTLNFGKNIKSFPVLTSINRTENSVTRRKSRRCSLVSVVSPSSTPKVVELMEPSSPPKIKVVACSKQSKKNLKRLQF